MFGLTVVGSGCESGKVKMTLPRLHLVNRLVENFLYLCLVFTVVKIVV